MTKPKLTGKRLYNVHKLVYLANEYPDRPIRELATLFAMNALDINTAIWQARDIGLLFVDDKTGNFKVERVPEKWQLGPEVEDLMETILYVIGRLNEDEQDLEENALSAWVMGIPTHDVVIAMRQLLAKKKISTYEVVNVNKTEPSKKGLKRGKEPKITEDTYTFYTLYENGEQQWGRKQFQDQTKLK